MPIKLSPETTKQLVTSIKRYATENLDEEIGDLKAGLFLDYCLQEIGAVVYNQAIADAQTRLLQRVADLNGELFADEFQYWPRADAKRKSRR